MWSSRRAARAVACAADDHRGRLAQQLRPQPLPEPAGDRPLERLRQLPRREVEQRHDDRQARTRSAAARRRPRGRRRPAAPPRSARQAAPSGGAAQQERIDGHRRRSAAGGSAAAAAGRRPRGARSGRSGRRGRTASRNANDSPVERLGVEGAEQAVEVGGGRAAPGPGSWSGRASRTTRTPGDRRRPRAPSRRVGDPVTTRRDAARSRPRSSSARSWTTTTSASTTIRRLILRLADAAVAEGDRDLADPRPGAARPGRSSRSGRRSRRHGRRRTGRPASVVARHALKPPVRSFGREAEHDPGEQAAAARDRSAGRCPSPRPPPPGV